MQTLNPYVASVFGEPADLSPDLCVQLVFPLHGRDEAQASQQAHSRRPQGVFLYVRGDVAERQLMYG